jgi:hypothetical protein
VIETDWAAATFTMNWKLTCIGLPVSFRAGEPIAMIMPVRRGELEDFEITIRDLKADPDVEGEYAAWAKSRREFLQAFDSPKQNRSNWQKDYFFGNTARGTAFEHHQTSLKVREVVDETGTNSIPLSSQPMPGNIGTKYRKQRFLEQLARRVVRKLRTVLGPKK